MMCYHLQRTLLYYGYLALTVIYWENVVAPTEHLEMREAVTQPSAWECPSKSRVFLVCWSNPIYKHYLNTCLWLWC